MNVRVSKNGLVKTAVLSTLVSFSSAVMAHNEETASSVVATLIHQLASPDHLLVMAGALVLAVGAVIYGPSLYRRIRQDKR